MKISLVVSDLHGPILGATTAVARHLVAAHDVQIVGPDFGRGVSPMYRDAWDYTAVPCSRLYRFPDFFWEWRRLQRAITGDAVIAIKAVGNTVPLAWWEKVRRGRKALVYLDEWDGATMAQKSPAERRAQWRRHWHHPLDEVYYPYVERLVPRLDHVISTSTFLQKKFGGSIVPFGVDCAYFSPSSEQASVAMRKSFDLDSFRLIVFGGVVRPHKGIEEILDALVTLGDVSIKFVVVGPVNDHVKQLQANARYAPHLVCLGPQPRDKMPGFISMADLVILPLNRTLLAQSQVPCKVFEAMALARPILASQVSDLPLILDGCGWTFPAGDHAALVESIRHILAHSDEARERGRLAREKCLREYSDQVARQKWLSIVDNL